MLVKICGLTRHSDAALAEALGADFIGVIMAGGPRHLSEKAAAHVLGPRRHSVRRTVVFGDQSLSEIERIALSLDLDAVQLHGQHVSAGAIDWLRKRLNCAVWPVLRVEGTTLPENSHAIGAAAGTLLLDAKVVGQLGGTGVALDWNGLSDAVQSLRNELPKLQIILAGGLNASNVSVAAQLLSPDVVDVSSGVESTPGVKDADSLEAFILAARAITGINERA
ncbi:MAG: phosphoribosylanthranilate isomerase [Gemmatimonadota bacterium]|nr:phosphoribosylanthranilate isomerase [Gemmatimonadota bacterium]